MWANSSLSTPKMVSRAVLNAAGAVTVAAVSAAVMCMLHVLVRHSTTQPQQRRETALKARARALASNTTTCYSNELVVAIELALQCGDNILATSGRFVQCFASAAPLTV